jgi:hypothetical protein
MTRQSPFFFDQIVESTRIIFGSRLANRRREDNIRLCRTLLDAQSPNVRDAALTRQEQPNSPDRCPLCNEGSMRPVEILLPQALALARAPIPITLLRCDTS